MATQQLEARVAALEAEIARLKKRLEREPAPARPWWKEIAGGFAGDPIFAEAMRLGADYRQSLRPKAAKRSRKQDVRSRLRSP
jgi:hypothetical protein